MMMMRIHHSQSIDYSLAETFNHQQHHHHQQQGNSTIFSTSGYFKPPASASTSAFSTPRSPRSPRAPPTRTSTTNSSHTANASGRLSPYSFSTTDLPSASSNFDTSSFVNISLNSTDAVSPQPPKLGFSSGSNLDLYKMQTLQSQQLNFQQQQQQQQQQQSHNQQQPQQDNTLTSPPYQNEELFLTSYLYDWTKKSFLQPDEGYDV